MSAVRDRRSTNILVSYGVQDCLSGVLNMSLVDVQALLEFPRSRAQTHGAQTKQHSGPVELGRELGMFAD